MIKEEKLDALLINPPWISKDQNIWHGIKAAMPPLGLLSIAACLEKMNQSVRVFDVHVERWSMDEFRKQLRVLRPRVIGITMMTATAIAANRLARICREVHPEATIVVGGVHAEAMPAECLKNSSIDAVVRGDGEKTFARIVAGDPLLEIPGVSFRNGNLAVHNVPADVIMNLDELPMPAYHLVPMDRYYPAIGAYRRLPAINMLMTRGCPGKCTFCNSAETTLRMRSAARVVEEIAHLKKQYGIREIQFYDDTFTIMKQNCFRFCELMKERKLGVTWTAFVRTDCFSEAMAKALKAGGCHQVMFGVESGDDQILRNIRKPIDKAKTCESVRIARRAGLEVRCTFMLGNPGESVESMERTVRFAMELDPDLALFNITTPYPGTQMFNWAKKRNYLTTEDWGEYELSGSVMHLPTVDPATVNEHYHRAHRAFYRRPRVLWRRLKRMRNISHFRDNVHAFFHIVLRRNIGHRDFYRVDWIASKKEDFWDVPLVSHGIHEGYRTSEVSRLKITPPQPTPQMAHSRRQQVTSA